MEECAMGLFRRLIDSEYKELKRFEKIANQIDALSDEMEALSDEELRAKTDEFKKELEEGKTLDDIVVPAFAVVREAAYRVIGEKPYFVQLLGGLAIKKSFRNETFRCAINRWYYSSPR